VVPGVLDVDVCAGAKLAALKATIRVVISFTRSFPPRSSRGKKTSLS
jgi:hypothetical protein